MRLSPLYLILIINLIASPARAESVRAGNWEAAVHVVGTSSEKSNGENGSSLDVDSDTGFGFVLHYTFDANLALGFDMLYAKPRYRATFNTEEEGLVSVRHEMSVYSGQFNGTWNLMEGAFTPYLQLGAGWTYVDSNVSDGPPVTGCWWDPWWGYVCRNFYSTYSDTNFSWGYGAGLRFEFLHNMYLKASYNRVEINADSDVDAAFDTAKFELGWILR